MTGDFPQVHGKPTPKFGLTQPGFPTQAQDDVVLTEDVAYVIAANGAVDFTAPSFGTPHPRSGDHKLVAVAFLGGNEGKAWYRLTFSKLPGHLLPGSSVSEQTWGAPATVTKQSVATGTGAATGLGVIRSDVQPQDANLAVATETSVPAWPSLTTTRINERGDTETVTQTKVAPCSALPAFDFTTVSISQQAETKDRATLALATVGGYSTLTDTEGVSSNRSLLHFVSGARKTTTHAIVAPGTAPVAGFLVMGSEVHAKDVVHSNQTTTTITAWPVLNSSEAADSQAHGAATATVETVVPSGAALAVTPSTGSGGTPAFLTVTPAQGDTPAVTVPMLDVLEAKVDDTNGTHSIQTVKRLAAGESWPTLTEKTWDVEMAVEITKARTVVAAGSVTVGSALFYLLNWGAAGSDTNTGLVGPLPEDAVLPFGTVPWGFQVTEEDPIDEYKSWQVVTTHPAPAANGMETAVLGSDTTGYKFPDLLDVNALTYFGQLGVAAGGQVEPLYYTAREATLANVQTAKYWVVSATEPTLPELAEILPNDFWSYFVQKTYPRCIHNASWCSYSTSSGPTVIQEPASTPDFSTYMSEWVDNWKIIKARIAAVKYQLLWQVETESVLMLGPVVQSSPEATTVGASGDTMSGTVNPNGQAVTYGFVYFPTPTFGQTTPVVVGTIIVGALAAGISTATAFSADCTATPTRGSAITGHGTDYTFCAWAQLSGGMISSGLEMTGTTT